MSRNYVTKAERSRVRIKLAFPLPPNVANPRKGDPQHHYARSRSKKSYTETVLQLHTGRQFPHLVRIEYTAHLIVPGQRDRDNLVRMLKWPQDALAKLLGFPSDADKYVYLKDIPTQSVVQFRARKQEDAATANARRLKLQRQHGVYLDIVGVLK